jgi:hypothetical protein
VDNTDPDGRCCPCVIRKWPCGPRTLPELSIQSLRRAAQGERLPQPILSWLSKLSRGDQELVMKEAGEDFRMKARQSEYERLSSGPPQQNHNDFSRYAPHWCQLTSSFDNSDPYSTTATYLDHMPAPQVVSCPAPSIGEYYTELLQSNSPSSDNKELEDRVTPQFNDASTMDNDGNKVTDFLPDTNSPPLGNPLEHLHSLVRERFSLLDPATIDAECVTFMERLAFRSQETTGQRDENMSPWI